MTEKKVFTKDNLSELLRLQADAIDKGEVLEFEDGLLGFIDFKYRTDYIFRINDDCWVSEITLKPKPQLRKATALEWLEWACSDDCKGWAVFIDGDYFPTAPQMFNYLNAGDSIERHKRAKFENGKLGEFDYFWVEV